MFIASILHLVSRHLISKGICKKLGTAVIFKGLPMTRRSLNLLFIAGVLNVNIESIKCSSSVFTMVISIGWKSHTLWHSQYLSRWSNFKLPCLIIEWGVDLRLVVSLSGSSRTNGWGWIRESNVTFAQTRAWQKSEPTQQWGEVHLCQDMKLLSSMGPSLLWMVTKHPP